MIIEKLTPAFKDYLWGGNKMKELYNKQNTLAITAESWELSCHPDGGSRIANGDVVKLDTLGTFYPAIRSMAVDTPEKVNQHSIKGVGMLFKPSARLMKIVKKAGVNLADNRVFDAETHARRKQQNY